MKEKICIGIGAAGGLLAAALGGWDLGLQVLLGFMAADLGTGLLTAGVFHNSPHTKDGRLDSRCCFQGMCRKARRTAFGTHFAFLHKTTPPCSYQKVCMEVSVHSGFIC